MFHWSASWSFCNLKTQRGSKEGREGKEVGQEEQEDTLELQHAFERAIESRLPQTEGEHHPRILAAVPGPILP